MGAVSIDAMQDRTALTMGGLGVFSGIVSAAYGFTFEPEWLQPIARLFFLESGMVPIGAYYGVAIGLGVALCTGRLWAAPLLLITTMIAWSAAIHAALPIIKVGGNGTEPLRNVLAGLTSGALGAALTYAGVALAVSVLRRSSSGFLLVTGVGAMCGLLHALGEAHVVPMQTLYVVWQPAVAYCIGLAMAGASATAAPR